MVGGGDRDLVATSRGRALAPLWQRALTAAVDTIVPSLAKLVAAGARHLLEHQRGTRMIVHPSRRPLPTADQALPRSGQVP